MDNYGDKMEVSIIDAWKKVVDNLTLSVGQGAVNLWFTGVKPVSLNESVFVRSSALTKRLVDSLFTLRLYVKLSFTL